MRNINEFNIPTGNTHGYEILYFGTALEHFEKYEELFTILYLMGGIHLR
jgi:hypothetical protein